MPRREKKPPVHPSTSEATSPLPPANSLPPAPLSEEVPAPRRRTFSAEFKQQVLAEADACRGPGEVGALLRRYGLYSSHLTEWRGQRNRGAMAGLAPRKRGRKARAPNPLVAEVARLERENKKLLARAERAERLVELQKKIAELLGDPLPPPELPTEEAAERQVRKPRRTR